MADDNTINCKELDSVVTGVLRQFVGRANFGRLKYGTNLDRTDLSTLYWIVFQKIPKQAAKVTFKMFCQF